MAKRKETAAQGKVVERVMHEFAHGELKTGAGAKVKSRRQAVAIALSEAGESNRVDPATNRKRLATTRKRERAGDTARARTEQRTKADLYAEAKKREVPGRSTMSKAELARALA